MERFLSLSLSLSLSLPLVPDESIERSNRFAAIMQRALHLRMNGREGGGGVYVAFTVIGSTRIRPLCPDSSAGACSGFGISNLEFACRCALWLLRTPLSLNSIAQDFVEKHLHSWKWILPVGNGPISFFFFFSFSVIYCSITFFSNKKRGKDRELNGLWKFSYYSI